MCARCAKSSAGTNDFRAFARALAALGTERAWIVHEKMT